MLISMNSSVSANQPNKTPPKNRRLPNTNTKPSVRIYADNKAYLARGGFASLRYDPFTGTLSEEGDSVFDFRVVTGWRLIKPEALPELIESGWLVSVSDSADS